MNVDTNPFPSGSARNALWQMLVQAETEAVLKQDFSLLNNHYIRSGFWGIHAGKSADVEPWRLQFTRLEDYQKFWEQQTSELMKNEFAENVRTALFRCTFLREIEIENDIALVRKKYNGFIKLVGNSTIPMQAQTLYQCRKVDGAWKIMSFITELPLNSAMAATAACTNFRKTVPAGAQQHKTAGPYAPVLVVRGQELVVISGQVALDLQGNLVGKSIVAQTHQTLANARIHLQAAGIDFKNVFKVNVYLKDLADWQQFNEIYKTTMPEPLPARTAIEAKLLNGFVVELDMWAMR